MKQVQSCNYTDVCGIINIDVINFYFTIFDITCEFGKHRTQIDLMVVT